MTKQSKTLAKGGPQVTCGRQEQKAAWSYELVASGVSVARGMKSWEKRVYGSLMKARGGAQQQQMKAIFRSKGPR